MSRHPVVTREQWIEARKALLEREKSLTRLNDEIAYLRRQLPWVKVDKAYLFETHYGQKSLAELFEEANQLVVYHFMFGPEWEQGCVSCSFWADNFNGLTAHLKHRNITLIAISRAPLDKLLSYRARMGWDFNWVSSLGSTFNEDFDVSFSPAALADEKVYYNYDWRSFPVEEAPGMSVFYRDLHGDIYHTYSCYARGLDALNSAYQIMDRVPEGRNEDELPYPMSWLRRHDRYED